MFRLVLPGTWTDKKKLVKEVFADQIFVLQALIGYTELTIVPLQVLPTAGDHFTRGVFMDRQHELSTLRACDCLRVELLHFLEVLGCLQQLGCQLTPCLVIPLFSSRVEVAGHDLRKEFNPLGEVPLEALYRLTVSLDFVEQSVR